MSIVDLPENLQPATFLCDIEDALAPDSQEVVCLCKKAQTGDPANIAGTVQEAERLWTRYGDELGHAIAFLYLADSHWKCRDVTRAIEFCSRTFPNPYGNVSGASKTQVLRQGLIRLRDSLRQCFNYAELQDLCFDLGVDFEDLEGGTKACKTRELVALLKRAGRIPELIAYCARKRPNIPWQDILDAVQRAAETPVGSYSEWLPISAVVKAVRHYLLGLSYHISGRLPDASHSYKQAFAQFQQAQEYWQGWECNAQLHAYSDILEWTKRLDAYVRDLRSSLQREAAADQKLICPWQSSIREPRYAVAELELTEPVAKRQVSDQATVDFITRRAQPWYRIGNAQIDGYKVSRKSRILWPNNASRHFDLNILNTAAQLDGGLVLPAGALYYVLPIDNQHALPRKNIRSGDYLLACSVVVPQPDDPERIELFPRQGEAGIVLGAFRRDSQGHIHPVYTPPIVMGRDLTGLDPWQVDYCLKLSPPPPPDPGPLPYVLEHK